MGTIFPIGIAVLPTATFIPRRSSRRRMRMRKETVFRFRRASCMETSQDNVDVRIVQAAGR
jgi:hypothetical protein